MDLLLLVITFVALVAPFLIGWLAHKHLSERRASAERNEEDLNTGTPSSQIRPSGNRYEVFLSFRGVDTRHGFTDYLYCSLVDAGIHVFRDNIELRVGEEVGSGPREAIENSKILIPIISKNYASSKWCLQELVHIMECQKHSGHKVFPIFYNVEPSDVRYQRGSFEKAFHRLRSRYAEGDVEKWKQALNEVASLQGFETADRLEVELVNLVVRKVLKELKNAMKLVVHDYLVGIDSHVEEVMGLVNENSRAVLRMGIYGMEGIGKTTLAKAIYNKLFDSFEHHSFIADIEESCNRYGINYLQNQLIYDMKKEKIQFHDSNERIKYISSRFKYKKVLIFLDDVDTADQLEGLGGNPNWFGPGSRILVTTRNKSTMERAGVEIKYELKEMDEKQSLILFSRHAFGRDYPPSEFLAHSRLVVSITGGLPLALKILGSLLCGSSSTVWREAIEKMQNAPLMEMQEKLRISYEQLNEVQRHLFLDIACFLIGSDARVASYVWESCDFHPRVEIEVLKSLSLIKIGDNHEFIMHKHVRDLGREIVRAENIFQPHERSRLWVYEEALEVLESKKGTERIEGICLEEGGSNYINDQESHTFTDEQFRNLSNLMFLHMSDVNLGGDFSDLFSQLRWLKWGNCPSTFEARKFHAVELVILDLSGSPISDVWQGWPSMMMAKKLKVLNLKGCRSLKRSFFLSAFTRLEILILRDCGELEQIDPCIGDMKNLVSLDLSGCLRLKDLPLQMAKLQQLNELLLDETAIQEIPSFISSLKNLEMLSARDCKSLIGFPNSMGSLENLSTLVLSGCVELATLPDSFRSLKNLRCLSLGGCHKLREIPSWIGELKSLTQLDSSGCSCLEQLPPQMGELKQ